MRVKSLNISISSLLMKEQTAEVNGAFLISFYFLFSKTTSIFLKINLFFSPGIDILEKEIFFTHRNKSPFIPFEN